MAKDVAMFANASGGVVLLGACDAAGRLTTYRPLPESDLQRVKDAYETAVRDLCSPVPVIDVLPIRPIEGSGTIVAVNVYAFPGAPVGVLWVNDGGALVYAF